MLQLLMKVIIFLVKETMEEIVLEENNIMRFLFQIVFFKMDRLLIPKISFYKVRNGPQTFRKDKTKNQANRKPRKAQKTSFSFCFSFFRFLCSFFSHLVCFNSVLFFLGIPLFFPPFFSNFFLFTSFF